MVQLFNWMSLPSVGNGHPEILRLLAQTRPFSCAQKTQRSWVRSFLLGTVSSSSEWSRRQLASSKTSIPSSKVERNKSATLSLEIGRLQDRTRAALVVVTVTTQKIDLVRVDYASLNAVPACAFIHGSHANERTRVLILLEEKIKPFFAPLDDPAPLSPLNIRRSRLFITIWVLFFSPKNNFDATTPAAHQILRVRTRSPCSKPRSVYIGFLRSSLSRTTIRRQMFVCLTRTGRFHISSIASPLQS